MGKSTESKGSMKSDLEALPPAYEEVTQTTITLPPYSDDPEAAAAATTTTVTSSTTITIDEQLATTSSNTRTQHRQQQQRRPRNGFTKKLKAFSLIAIFVFVAYKFIYLCKQLNRNINKDDTSSSSSSSSLLSSLAEKERSTTIRSIFDPISGNFDLYDLLDLSTVTADIDVTITPKPGNGPAVLKLHSVTGSITVTLNNEYMTYVPDLVYDRNARPRFREGGVAGAGARHHPPCNKNKKWKPKPNNPNFAFTLTSEEGKDGDLLEALDRRFETEIRTNTGAVNAVLIIGGGGHTEITSQTGQLDIDARAVGVNPGTKNGVSTLTTITSPGSQNVRVRTFVETSSKLRDGDGIQPMTKLKGRHLSQGFGSMDVQYPPNWEGTVEAKVQGWGTVSVEGRELVLDEKVGDGFVKAHQGDGEVEVTVTGQGVGKVRFVSE